MLQGQFSGFLPFLKDNWQSLSNIFRHFDGGEHTYPQDKKNSPKYLCNIVLDMNSSNTWYG